MGQQIVQRGGEGLDVARGDQEARHAILDQFGNSGDPRCKHRQPSGHRLHQDDRNALGEGRQREHVTLG